MFKKRQKHTVPGLNTTSTADISFMLLIFFLVTTSMDSDKGLARQLPPQDPDKQEKPKDIDRTMVMTIHLMKDGTISIDDNKSGSIDDEMRKEVRHFIMEKGKGHIIELQVDRDAEYDRYFRLQNELMLAYQELRNAASKKKYGKPFSRCNEDEHEAILNAYPQRIQEIVINNI